MTSSMTSQVPAPPPTASAHGSPSAAPATPEQRAAALYRDGIVALPGVLPVQWVDDLAADFEACFAAARSYPRGTISRGPNRYYFAVHPERITRFAGILTQPDITTLCEEVLGADYQWIELGFDVPLPGAKDQPWHRDFATPPETADGGRLTSLAFNITTVDVTPDLAPFEIAHGTHRDDGSGFDHGMFPPQEAYERYAGLASRRFPQRGDVSARTGLTVHRGTENHADRSRAVLILGAVTGDTDPSAIEVHDLVVTRAYHESLPADLRSHLRCTVVDELSPIAQKHDIEGLMMG